jgi:carnosine N-methyltransferase
MELDNEDEREHWWQVMRTFLHYLDFVENEIERRQKHINKLSNAHISRLPQITFEKLGLLHQGAGVNQIFFDNMVKYHASNSFLEPPSYAIDDSEDIILPQKHIGPPTDIAQHHRNQAVLHSLYREWSAEASSERAESFGVLLEELVKRLPINDTNAFTHHVLVPGCGLGRLALEVASKGYCCEGNEFSA